MNLHFEQQLTRHYQRLNTAHIEHRDIMLEELRNEAPPHLRIRAHRFLIPATLSGLAAAILLACVLWFFWVGPGSLSWAQVARQLQHVNTFTCVVSEESRYADGSMAVPKSAAREYLRFPAQMRSESLPTSGQRFVEIVNPIGHPHTTLTVRDGVARVRSEVTFGRDSGMVLPRQAESLMRLREISTSQQMRRQGSERIGGRMLVRFRGPSSAVDPTMPRGTLDVWVDPATKLPVRLLLQGSAPFVAREQSVTIEMRDVQFDLPLADSLFAWPDTSQSAQKIEQTIWIEVPPGTPAVALPLAIGPVGQASLVEPSNVVPSRAVIPTGTGAGRVLGLSSHARRRVEAFTSSHVGSALQTRIGNSLAEEVVIAGPVSHVWIAVRTDPATPADKH